MILHNPIRHKSSVKVRIINLSFRFHQRNLTLRRATVYIHGLTEKEEKRGKKKHHSKSSSFRSQYFCTRILR